MKKLLMPLLLIAILAGCKTELKDEIVELHSNGKVKKIQYYELKRGEKKVVKEIEYYQSGEKKMEGSMLNNKRNGEWKSYHKNGKIWSVGNYKSGTRVGDSKVFYEDGTKRIEGQYDNGNRIGLWNFYDEKGQKIKEVVFAADSIVSEEEFFYGIPFNK